MWGSVTDEKSQERETKDVNGRTSRNQYPLARPASVRSRRIKIEISTF